MFRDVSERSFSESQNRSKRVGVDSRRPLTGELMTMKLQRTALIASLLMYPQVVATAWADVFVADPGSDSAAIQRIIDKASAAEKQPATVLFGKGEYTIDATIHVRSGIILKGHGAESKLIIKKPPALERGDVRPAIRIEAVGGNRPAVIEGLGFTSILPNEIDSGMVPGYKGGSTAILAIDCDNLTVRRCSFERIYGGIIAYAARQCIFERNDMRSVHRGITLSCSEKNVHDGNNIIRDNRFIPFGYVAINIWKQDKCQVTGNYCEGRDKRTGGAIFFTSCNDTVVRDNIVSNCENGIQFVTHGGRRCDRNLIENNVVYGCHPFSPSGSGLSLQADYAGSFNDNIFRRNTVFDCDSGIAISQPNPAYIGPTANTLIEDNDIRDCTEWGILLDGACDTTIRNNRIVNTKFVGIELRKAPSGKPSSRNTIENNFIYNNAICGLLIGPGNDNNTIVGNILKDNFKGEIRVNDASHTIVKNNLIHETMNYNKSWNDSKEGLGIFGGTDNIVENNRYYWQRD